MSYKWGFPKQQHFLLEVRQFLFSPDFGFFQAKGFNAQSQFEAEIQVKAVFPSNQGFLDARQLFCEHLDQKFWDIFERKSPTQQQSSPAKGASMIPDDSNTEWTAAPSQFETAITDLAVNWICSQLRFGNFDNLLSEEYHANKISSNSSHVMIIYLSYPQGWEWVGRTTRTRGLRSDKRTCVELFVFSRRWDGFATQSRTALWRGTAWEVMKPQRRSKTTITTAKSQ